MSSLQTVLRDLLCGINAVLASKLRAWPPACSMSWNISFVLLVHLDCSKKKQSRFFSFSSGMSTTTTPTPTMRTVPRRHGNGSMNPGALGFILIALDTGLVCAPTHERTNAQLYKPDFTCFFFFFLFCSFFREVPERVQRLVRSSRVEGVAWSGEEQPLLQLYSESQWSQRKAWSSVSTGKRATNRNVVEYFRCFR